MLLFFLIIVIANKKDINIIKINNIDTINEIGKLKEDEKTSGEKTSNNDIVGHIKINGTNINNEIVQAKDNNYYLNHNINKEEDYNGSIFLDYRNKIGDRKYLIYGHNSKTLKNALFHDLEKYIDYSFYEKNKYIELTINDEKSKWQIFSIMIVDKKTNNHMKITFNDKEWQKHIKWMVDNSIYNTNVDVNVGDKVLTLQTCYYKPNDSYLLINAKKI